MTRRKQEAGWRQDRNEKVIEKERKRRKALKRVQHGESSGGGDTGLGKNMIAG